MKKPLSMEHFPLVFIVDDGVDLPKAFTFQLLVLPSPQTPH